METNQANYDTMQDLLIALSATKAVPARQAGQPLSEKALRLNWLQFDQNLPPKYIRAFRRQINTFIGAADDRFHNHDGAPDRYLYRYPCIQYKSVGNKAAILGLGDAGAEALDALTAEPEFRSFFVDSPGPGLCMRAESSETLYLYQSLEKTYRLTRYLALNEGNFQAWLDKPYLAERVALLESCITGHILKFASAIQWQLPAHKLQVRLRDYQARAITEFDNRFLSFDLTFNTNIALPEGIGLGKAVSHGYGMLEVG